MTGSSSLKQLIDRQAITDQVYSYCRAVDRIDQELGYSIWHEGGTAHYDPLYKGSGRGCVDWVCAQHRALIGHSHQVSNILIRLDGDKANSEAYVSATLHLRDGARLIQVDVRGRYIDRWSRRDERWGIDHREYVHDLDKLEEVPAIYVEGWGRRDQADLSYRTLPSDVEN